MTRSGLPSEPAVPDPSVGELQALYREAASEEPGPALDHRILDAARAEVQAARRAKRPPPWWRGWLPLTSAIAVAAVGLSLTWRVIDQQERELREETNAAGAADARPGKPAPADESASMAQSREADRVRERRDARLAAPAAPGPERAEGKLEAKRLDSGGETAADALAPPATNAAAGMAARSAAQAVDAASPQAWLQQIRDLRAAGRHEEALQSLARFRARYPDFVLPEDLLNLK